MIRYAVVGAGWRSEFYLRIAAALPDLFECTGIFIRNENTAKEFAKKHSAAIYSSLDALLDTNPDFVVSCVSKANICDEIELLCKKGVAVLSETPVGDSEKATESFLERFDPSWRVQVAEQFHLQPQNQAIKSVIDSGVIGKINHLQICFCHDYHAVSLIRYFLGAGNCLPKVKSVEFDEGITLYNSRGGYISPTHKNSTHTLAFLDYGGKTALYDFVKEQYFSDIRGTRIIIRGDKGEIFNDTCTYLQDGRVRLFRLERIDRGTNGNLDGLYLDSIVAQGNLLYKNPFYKARLTDEEIAIATCLTKMDKYLKDGTPFYSAEDAALDAKTAFLFHNNEV